MAAVITGHRLSPVPEEDPVPVLDVAPRCSTQWGCLTALHGLLRHWGGAGWDEVHVKRKAITSVDLASEAELLLWEIKSNLKRKRVEWICWNF